MTCGSILRARERRVLQVGVVGGAPGAIDKPLGALDPEGPDPEGPDPERRRTGLFGGSSDTPDLLVWVLRGISSSDSISM